MLRRISHRITGRGRTTEGDRQLGFVLAFVGAVGAIGFNLSSLAIVAGALSGCNTVKGLGQDFQALGDAVKQTLGGK